MWREFRFVRKRAADLVWMIKNNGESYETQHGQLNGKLQSNSDTPGSKGKEDTKSYVDPVANCEFHVKREIRKKKESGYIEYVDGQPTEEQVTSFTFDDFLPKNFCSYKPNPQNSMSDSWHAKTYKKGLARYTRKYNGLCQLFVYHTWGWEVYSRRMDTVTEKFPHHIRKLEERHKDLGVGTILVGEMICKRGLSDDLKSVSRIGQSDPEEARRIIEEREVPEPTFVLFDILFHNHDDLSDKTYDERVKIWKRSRIAPLATTKRSLVTSVDYYNVNPDNWEEVAKGYDWEGFVVVDGSSKPGDYFYTFSGKPKRPRGSYKLKPIYEEDVVVYAGLEGTGKRFGQIGSIFVKQQHPETGEWFDCGKVGSGFKDEDQPLLKGLIEKHGLPIFSKTKDAAGTDLSESKGFVIEVKYYERQEGTNKFQFPVFLRVRYDKGVEECEAQRLSAV
jgi:ATP-dependent DNA ligase